MNSKETKINIDVNISGTRFSVSVPFSEQDSVRSTESEMKVSLKNLRDKYSKKNLAECMAMMAFDYASRYFALKSRYEASISDAEELLRDIERLLGEDDNHEDLNTGGWEFGTY